MSIQKQQNQTCTMLINDYEKLFINPVVFTRPSQIVSRGRNYWTQECADVEKFFSTQSIVTLNKDDIYNEFGHLSFCFIYFNTDSFAYFIPAFFRMYLEDIYDYEMIGCLSQNLIVTKKNISLNNFRNQLNVQQEKFIVDLLKFMSMHDDAYGINKGWEQTTEMIAVKNLAEEALNSWKT